MAQKNEIYQKADRIRFDIALAEKVFEQEHGEITQNLHIIKRAVDSKTKDIAELRHFAKSRIHTADENMQKYIGLGYSIPGTTDRFYNHRYPMPMLFIRPSDKVIGFHPKDGYFYFFSSMGSENEELVKLRRLVSKDTIISDYVNDIARWLVEEYPILKIDEAKSLDREQQIEREKLRDIKRKNSENRTDFIFETLPLLLYLVFLAFLLIGIVSCVASIL